MPDLPFPDDVRALLTKANPAVVTTLRSDGQPDLRRDLVPARGR